jgi:hypothetical protein
LLVRSAGAREVGWTVRQGLFGGTRVIVPVKGQGILRTFDQAAASARGLLTLVTPTNTMSDWINTGRTYVRAQLAADVLGLRFQPVSQSLQEFPEMDTPRAKMDALVGVTSPAKQQMLARMGRSRPPGLSPRRELGRIVRR